jgi:hypothetical protein
LYPPSTAAASLLLEKEEEVSSLALALELLLSAVLPLAVGSELPLEEAAVPWAVPAGEEAD